MKADHDGWADAAGRWLGLHGGQTSWDILAEDMVAELGRPARAEAAVLVRIAPYSEVRLNTDNRLAGRAAAAAAGLGLSGIRDFAARVGVARPFGPPRRASGRLLSRAPAPNR